MNTKGAGKSAWATGTALLVWGGSVFAVEDNALFSMSLEELMAVEVTVASTRPEKIHLTPAIVSSINISEMRSMGVHTIEAMLAMLPGFVNQSNAATSAPQMVRGVTEVFDQKILFLLDGVPYWQPAHSSIALPGISLSSVERVEVIRGPGAVIYGTNASGGVINIITKGGQAASEPANTLSLQVASHEAYQLASYNHFSSERFSLDFGLEVAGESGYESSMQVYGEGRESIVAQGVHKEQDTSSLWLKLSGQGLKVFLHAFNHTSHGASLNVNPLVQKDRGKLLAVNYNFSSGNNAFSIYADINQFYPEVSSEILSFSFDNNGKDNLRKRMGFKSDFEVVPQFSLQTGIEYELRESGNYVIGNAQGEQLATMITAGEVAESSFFLQGDYQFNQTRVLAGFRAVDNENGGSKVLPRVSLVNQVSEYGSVKLLYSVGFNSPNFVQQYMNLPAISLGNEDLEAETVAMWDLAYVLNFNSSRFTVDLYHYDADNFIQRGMNDDGVVEYQNTQRYSRSGLEIEYHRRINQWSLLANTSYHYRGNSKNENDIALLFTPEFTANLGTVYRFKNRHSLGASLQFIGQRAAADQSVNINVNYRYTGARYELDLAIANLLGGEVNTPDLSSFEEELYSAAQDEDSTFLLEFRWRY